MSTDDVALDDREWLVTFGTGGYASGSVDGIPRRRYHALLVAALEPPVTRIALVSQVHERLRVHTGHTELEHRAPIELGSARWSSGAIAPDGATLIESFTLDDGLPTWTYRVPDPARPAHTIARLRKRIVPHGDIDAVEVHWTLLDTVDARDSRPRAPEALSIELALTLVHRDHHALRVDVDTDTFSIRQRTSTTPNRFTARFADGSVQRTDALGAEIDALLEGDDARFTLNDPASRLADESFVWRDLELETERARGYDHRDTLLHAATGFATLRPGRTLRLVLAGRAIDSTSDLDRLAAVDAVARHRDARTRRVARAHDAGQILPGPDASASAEAERLDDTFASTLLDAADQFLVHRSLPSVDRERAEPDGRGVSGSTIVAGYPWFTDWGRDTMIALPGLALACGRADDAWNLLAVFLAHERDGLIPNRFPDATSDVATQPEYHTADASLLALLALARTHRRAPDTGRLRALWPRVESIIAHHLDGTRFGIGVDPDDGLVRAEELGFQLTWMDAKIGDLVVTPRMGKPIELTALWVGALERFDSIVREIDDLASPALLDRCRKATELARHSASRFWNDDRACAFDVLDGPDGDDARVRPNQLYALGAACDLFDDERARRALATIDAKLVVPLGVRTLAPSDPDYRPTCSGDVRARDMAYHNGTAWPWLLSPWCAARERHAHDDDDRRRLLRDLDAQLDAARTHLQTACVGSISEILDGDAPHTPRGCVAQAWSVAAMIELLSARGRLQSRSTT